MRIAFLVSLFLLASVAEAQWLDGLPTEQRESVLWHGDVEEASLYDWEYPDFQFSGGGIFNTGLPPDAEVDATTSVVHSGLYSAKATIRGAFQVQTRAVRMFRWTERPWDDGGDFFPTTAYYSTWIYLPQVYNPNKYEPWDPGDGGWWNLFQFKSDDAVESQPIFTLNVDHDDAQGVMELYMYTKYNTRDSWGQDTPIVFPAGQWVHLEALYRQSDQERGRIVFWQDGRIILNAPRVRTVLLTPAHWSINNYTNHIVGGPVDGEATVYFDDAAVSERRLSGAFAPPVGAAGDGMLAEPGNGGIDLSWDTSCGALDYHLLYGNAASLPAYDYVGAVCNLGASGQGLAAVPDPLPGDLHWWVLVGADGATESHHGFDSTGLIRPAQGIGFCSTTAQGETVACP